MTHAYARKQDRWVRNRFEKRGIPLVRLDTSALEGDAAAAAAAAAAGGSAGPPPAAQVLGASPIPCEGIRLRTLSDTYRRYLENFFRKRFKLVGTPVRFVFKEGENPYKDKKNVLTDRQVARKKRLLRHVKRKG